MSDSSQLEEKEDEQRDKYPYLKDPVHIALVKDCNEAKTAIEHANAQKALRAYHGCDY